MCWKAFTPNVQYMEGNTYISKSQFPCPIRSLINLTDKLGIVDDPYRLEGERLRELETNERNKQ